MPALASQLYYFGLLTVDGVFVCELSGRLRLTLGEEDTVLDPGDAAFFDGMLPRAFDVLGEEDVAVLFVAGPCLAVIARWAKGEIAGGSTFSRRTPRIGYRSASDGGRSGRCKRRIGTSFNMMSW